MIENIIYYITKYYSNLSKLIFLLLASNLHEFYKLEESVNFLYKTTMLWRGFENPKTWADEVFTTPGIFSPQFNTPLTSTVIAVIQQVP